jgi:POT family proton-dependent oligopeptide transporter
MLLQYYFEHQFFIILGIAIWMLAKDYYTAGYLTLSDETLQALKIDKVTTALTLLLGFLL